jgi:ribonuclease P protein component
MIYEKNLPTKQNKKKKISRLPCENGDPRRTQSSQQEKTTRTLAADCIKFPFKKEMHVRKKWEFGKIRGFGLKYYGKYICFQYLIDPKNQTKIGLTVSRKFGDAIRRNLFKRRMRELFRQQVPNFAQSVHVNILPLQGCKAASFDELSLDWNNYRLYLAKDDTDARQT